MKLNKSTVFLLNVALVLLIAILTKTLFLFPKAAQAAANYEYKVANVGMTLISLNTNALERFINGWGTAGWKFVSYVEGLNCCIFEK